MEKLRIGILYHGNDWDIWGSMIITHYLQKAFLRLGYDVWRISVTEHNDYPTLLARKTDLLICEGVPEWQVPKGVWESSVTRIFWWESDLFYNIDTIAQSNFDAVVTNSYESEALKERGMVVQRVDLAVDRDIDKAKKKPAYRSDFVYMGRYPHKTKKQMELLTSSSHVGQLSLWGVGWDESPFQHLYKGVLPLFDIGSLYKSADISLLLTDRKQQKRGMFNNRVFEVLGSGAIAISEPYKALQESDLGEFIHFVSSEDELAEIYHRRNTAEAKKKRKDAQRYVLEKHNYDERAKDILNLYYHM